MEEFAPLGANVFFELLTLGALSPRKVKRIKSQKLSAVIKIMEEHGGVPMQQIDLNTNTVNASVSLMYMAF